MHVGFLIMSLYIYDSFPFTNRNSSDGFHDKAGFGRRVFFLLFIVLTGEVNQLIAWFGMIDDNIILLEIFKWSATFVDILSFYVAYKNFEPLINIGGLVAGVGGLLAISGARRLLWMIRHDKGLFDKNQEENEFSYWKCCSCCSIIPYIFKCKCCVFEDEGDGAYQSRQQQHSSV